MTEAEYAKSAINYECRKHRMTYERAGQYFRAMLMDTAMFPLVNLRDVDLMGLRLPDKPTPTFAEFIDLNAERLQLFDEPVRAIHHIKPEVTDIPGKYNWVSLGYKQEAL